MVNSIDKMQKQAEGYLAKGKTLEAIAIYEQIIQLEPNYAPAHSELGRALESQGWQELAIPHYTRALTLAPSNYSLESHLNFGNLLKSRGQIDQAIASYQRAISLNPTYIPAYKAWANALIEAQRLEEALAIYTQAEFDDLDLIRAKDYSDLGIACTDQGQLDLAIACFQKAIYLQPDYAIGHCNLGNALLQQGNHKEAIISFNEALSIDPSFAEVYYNLGLVLVEITKLDEAIACFEAAIALKPEFAEARNNLAQALDQISGS